MSARPNFEHLRRERDAAIASVLDAVAEKWGVPREEMMMHVSPGGCYCACPEGPCEHEFSGWRDFEDGNGGESVCKLCGLGAMMHDIRCGL